MSKPKKKHPNSKDALAPELLCAECIHDEIDVVRSSVIANELLNNQMRVDIDEVFDKCADLQKASPLNESHISHRSRSASPKKEESTAKIYSIKDLALRLQRLAILNARLKQNDIDRAKQIMEKRVNSLQARVNDTRQKIKAKEELLQKKREMITTLHQEVSQIRNERILRIQKVDTTRVAKQAANFQYNHFKVVRQVVFPKYELWRSQEDNQGSKSVKLDFFGQPILLLKSFLLHNNKLIAINMFLENLIHFQVLMVELLSGMGTPIHLPFLEFLKMQIPDGKFFDQVQEKINFLVDDGSEVQPDEKTADQDQDRLLEPRPSLDKIVIKDNVIQIPLSFKTANLQRRASVKLSLSASPTPEQFEPQIFLATPEPSSTTEVKLNNNEKPKPTTFQGKTMVIVPHKILTKPFTKLTLKEYLKFILVVVKILVNFEVLSLQTLDKVPLPKKKQPTRDLLASTYGHLRGETESADETKHNYDIRKILERFADMDYYFKHTIQQHSERLHLLASNNALTYSALIENTTEGTGNTSTASSAGNEDSFHNAPSSLHTHESSSKLRDFYNNYISQRQRQTRAPLTPTTDADRKIYGAVSQGYLEIEDDISKSSITGERSSIELDSTYRNGADSYDLKQFMDDVHKLVANGKGIGRDNGVDGDEAVKRATRTMMKNTQSQLEDWDVVSRLY